MKIATLVFLLATHTLAAENIYIYAKDYKNWPFKKKDYTLGCLVRGERKLIFIDNEDTYGINGQGREFGKQLFGWKDGNSQLKKGKLPIALQPFIEKGLTLCN